MLRSFASRFGQCLVSAVQVNSSRSICLSSSSRIKQIGRGPEWEGVEKSRAEDAPAETLEKLNRTSRGLGAVGGILSSEQEIRDSKYLTDRYVAYFKNPENDGWLARQAMNDLMAHPCVPEPEVTVEVMKSCRRMNDYALAVRFLESVQYMMQDQKSTIWPWYHQEIKNTLDDLGILTPEEMGYDKPELFMPEPEDM